MKPACFEYVAPRSEDEALAALAEHGDGAEVLPAAAANLSG